MPIENARPVGRPTEYREEYCNKLIEHMKKGYSFESFGAEVPGYVHCATLYRWAEAHDEFREAKKIGTILSLKYWERLGMLGCKGKIKGFNVAAWYINMKNKHLWSDDGPRQVEDKTERKKITVEIVQSKPTEQIEEAQTIEVENGKPNDNTNGEAGGGNS